MDWVTYLSPSGGGARLGALEDGDVHGCPVTDDLAALLDAGHEAMAEAHARAVDEPVEIIFEPEARLCAPLVPADPVAARFGDTVSALAPDLVRGVDDGVVTGARRARIGLAAVAGAAGPTAAYTMACLWLGVQGEPLQLTLGPDLVTRDGIVGGDGARVREFSAFVDERRVGHGDVDPEDVWFTAAGSGRVRALLCLETELLEPDDEVEVRAGTLGGFELRLGSLV
ncbi:hypothetical protein BJF83_02035 [Nocardiopsis sp. CNR-923]|uniref:hypothetical protein n=1 Tax=Nocardiopsis sp. CNR-923 TaxID=1904965 RepID=UPI000967BE43|nr:hypothetical protein [Nocardiopsis sp. CNR-923]OLT27378.1 hypothetical protein BJF83_02035 [Nocardiopsis sp. CNR-923]